MNKVSWRLFDLPMKKILFVCVHNSGRSQMAEAFFNRYARAKAHASSAGTRPASHTDRIVAEAMQELGIDISQQRPKLLTTEMLRERRQNHHHGMRGRESMPCRFCAC
jgi:arsenate reductase (thioredoxin)